jgi:hypothetical protein
LLTSVLLSLFSFLIRQSATLLLQSFLHYHTAAAAAAAIHQTNRINLCSIFLFITASL